MIFYAMVVLLVRCVFWCFLPHAPRSLCFSPVATSLFFWPCHLWHLGKRADTIFLIHLISMALRAIAKVSVFSFLMVALKIEAGRCCKGVSLRMMECPLAASTQDLNRYYHQTARCLGEWSWHLYAFVADQACFFLHCLWGYLAIFFFRLCAIVPFEGNVDRFGSETALNT